MTQAKQDIIKKYTQEAQGASDQAKRYSGITGTLRALGEQSGFLSKPNEPFSKLPLGEKAKMFLRETPRSTAQVLKQTAKTIAQTPFKVAYSLVDAPRTIATGKAIKTPLKIPGLGEVGTYARDVEQNLETGMNPLAASALSGGQAVADIAGLGLATQGAVKALAPVKKQILGPQMVNDVIGDAQKQISRLYGDDAANKLSVINPKQVQSWGDLFMKMRQAVEYDPRLLDAVKNHLKTRWHTYNLDPETPKFFGPEYVSGFPKPATQPVTQSVAMPLLIRKVFGSKGNVIK